MFWGGDLGLRRPHFGAFRLRPKTYTGHPQFKGATCKRAGKAKIAVQLDTDQHLLPLVNHDIRLVTDRQSAR